MQITGLSSGYGDSGAVGRRSELLEAVTERGASRILRRPADRTR